MGCTQSHKMRDPKNTKITQEEINNQLEEEIDDAFGGGLIKAMDQMERHLEQMMDNQGEANRDKDVQPSQ